MSGELSRRADAGGKAPRGRYIYAVVTQRAEQALNFKGLDDRPIYTVPYRGMAAVVSDLENDRIRSGATSRPIARS